MATYVDFLPAGSSDTGKTQRWDVVAKSSPTADAFPLGMIQWFGRWHQYAFFPNGNTVFEKTCLRDIASFCETASREHRRRRDG